MTIPFLRDLLTYRPNRIQHLPEMVATARRPLDLQSLEERLGLVRAPTPAGPIRTPTAVGGVAPLGADATRVPAAVAHRGTREGPPAPEDRLAFVDEGAARRAGLTGYRDAVSLVDQMVGAVDPRQASPQLRAVWARQRGEDVPAPASTRWENVAAGAQRQLGLGTLDVERPRLGWQMAGAMGAFVPQMAVASPLGEARAVQAATRGLRGPGRVFAEELLVGTVPSAYAEGVALGRGEQDVGAAARNLALGQVAGGVLGSGMRGAVGAVRTATRAAAPTLEALEQRLLPLQPYAAPAGVAAAAGGLALLDEEEGAGAALAAAPLAFIPGRGGRGRQLGGRFYSRLVEGVEKLKIEKAPAQTWLAKLSSGGPFKRAEFDVALRPWLEEQVAAGARLTKAEVLDAAERGMPRLTETRYGYEPGYPEHPEVQAAFDESRALQEARRRRLKSGEVVEDPEALEALEDEVFGRYTEAARAAGLPSDRILTPWQFRNNLGLEPVMDRAPRWEGYQSPGGTNYREVTLEAPPLDPNARNFQSTHWRDTPNVLAHLRMNDIETPDGKRFLNVIEVQSDWHQQGRETGYLEEGPDRMSAAARRVEELGPRYEEARKRHDAIERELYDLDREISDAPSADIVVRDRDGNEVGRFGASQIGDAQRLAYSNTHYDMAFEPKPEVDRAQMAERIATLERQRAEMQRAKEELSAAFRPWSEASGEYERIERNMRLGRLPPRGPLQETQEWAGLVMKRAIDEAVAGGYDGVTWSTPEAISRALRMDERWPELRLEEGGRVLRGRKPDGKGFEVALTDEQPLEAVVGREVAARLRREGTLTHVDLAPSGQRGFYGQILPDWVRGYAREMGVDLQIGDTPVPDPTSLKLARERQRRGERPPGLVVSTVTGEEPSWGTLAATLRHTVDEGAEILEDMMRAYDEWHLERGTESSEDGPGDFSAFWRDYERRDPAGAASANEALGGLEVGAPPDAQPTPGVGVLRTLNGEELSWEHLRTAQDVLRAQAEGNGVEVAGLIDEALDSYERWQVDRGIATEGPGDFTDFWRGYAEAEPEAATLIADEIGFAEGPAMPGAPRRPPRRWMFRNDQRAHRPEEYTAESLNTAIDDYEFDVRNDYDVGDIGELPEWQDIHAGLWRILAGAEAAEAQGVPLDRYIDGLSEEDFALLDDTIGLQVDEGEALPGFQFEGVEGAHGVEALEAAVRRWWQTRFDQTPEAQAIGDQLEELVADAREWGGGLDGWLYGNVPAPERQLLRRELGMRRGAEILPDAFDAVLTNPPLPAPVTGPRYQFGGGAAPGDWSGFSQALEVFDEELMDAAAADHPSQLADEYLDRWQAVRRLEDLGHAAERAGRPFDEWMAGLPAADREHLMLELAMEEVAPPASVAEDPLSGVALLRTQQGFLIPPELREKVRTRGQAYWSLAPFLAGLGAVGAADREQR